MLWISLSTRLLRSAALFSNSTSTSTSSTGGTNTAVFGIVVSPLKISAPGYCGLPMTGLPEDGIFSSPGNSSLQSASQESILVLVLRSFSDSSTLGVIPASGSSLGLSGIGWQAPFIADIRCVPRASLVYRSVLQKGQTNLVDSRRWNFFT